MECKAIVIDLDGTVYHGDRLDTDIQIGINGAMKTALVLTGATKMRELEQSSISPDYIVKSISEIPTISDKNHRA